MANKTICNKQIIKSVCILIEDGKPLSRIAEILGGQVSKSALYNWLDKGHKAYNKTFATAVSRAKEHYDTGRVKMGQVEQAEKHILTKTVRELKTYDIRTLGTKYKLPKGAKRIKGKPKAPPSMPPLSYSAQEHMEYAEKFLDLKFEKKLTKARIRMACQKRIDELSFESMARVRTEEQQVDPNQQAVKNVLTNMGPEDNRWNFKEEKELNLKGELKIENVMFGKPDKKVG